MSCTATHSEIRWDCDKRGEGGGEDVEGSLVVLPVSFTWHDGQVIGFPFLLYSAEKLAGIV